MKKLLILRFSAFGDIVQCMGTMAALRHQHPDLHIAWATKQEFASVVGLDQHIQPIFALPKGSGVRGLWQLAQQIRTWSPEMIYDAHQTPRSRALVLLLRLNGLSFQLVRRSKERWKRFLLFFCRINKFPKPFRGLISYGSPLQQAGLLPSSWHEPLAPNAWSFSPEDRHKLLAMVPDIAERVALVPSAAWEMKRWPLAHWQRLIALMPKQKFIVLGGPQDHFCRDLVVTERPEQVINLAGQLNLAQSCLAVALVSQTVSADTGLIHVADVLARPGICLMGPTAFGFTTSPAVKILEEEFPCRPCSKDGRGNCSRAIYQECMVAITPEKVVQLLKR